MQSILKRSMQILTTVLQGRYDALREEKMKRSMPMFELNTGPGDECRPQLYLWRHGRRGCGHFSWAEASKCMLSTLALTLVMCVTGGGPTAPDEGELQEHRGYWARPLAAHSTCFTETKECREANDGLPTWEPSPPLIILTACSSRVANLKATVAFVQAALALPSLGTWQVSPLLSVDPALVSPGDSL
jgi:hypothetical protein